MNVLVQRCRAWIVCAAIGICVHAQLAYAGPRTLQVQIGDEEAVHEILVHNAYITELHFPARITRVAATDNGRDYDIEALENKVLLRPKRNTAPGSVGNLLIESRKWRVVVLFRVAAHASDAVVSVTFKRPESPEDTPPTSGKDAPVTAKAATEADKPAAQADTAQADKATAQPDTPGSQAENAAGRAQATAQAEGTEPAHDAAEPPDEPAEKSAILRAAPGEPRVSVQVNGTLGRAVIGDRMAGDQTDGLLLAGMAALVAYPAGRYVAYDAGLTVAGSGMARFPGVMLDHDTGEMLRTMMLTRFELGASARLPVRLTPAWAWACRVARCSRRGSCSPVGPRSRARTMS
jgi:hypothetical protein